MAHDFFHVWGGVHECRICSLRTDVPLRTVAPCISKPATPEPPVWKGEGCLEHGETFLLDGRPMVCVSVAKPSYTPDPVTEFNERRRAKRLNAMAPGKSEGERSVYRTPRKLKNAYARLIRAKRYKAACLLRRKVRNEARRKPS